MVWSLARFSNFEIPSSNFFELVAEVVGLFVLAGDEVGGLISQTNSTELSLPSYASACVILFVGIF